MGNRLWMAVAVVIGLAATVLAILGTMFLGWTFGLASADLATRVNTVVAVCAFSLVAATLVVALIAYIAATGQPDLHAELTFARASAPNEPVLQVDPPADSGRPRLLTQFAQTDCEVNIVNRSRFAARNPGIRIELEDMEGLKEQAGWTIVTWRNMQGLTAIQWDGGADYLIHGRWARSLPQLNFTGVFVKQQPALVVIVAADGYGPKRVRIPVRVMEQDDYFAYTAEQARTQTADMLTEQPDIDDPAA